MRALVIYCHPNPRSFTATIRDSIVSCLTDRGAEVRLADLYAAGFDPVLSRQELASYADVQTNTEGRATAVSDLLWCDTLIFVYPTWWYGLPAMLKGWLDRVLVPGVAFHMPRSDREGIRPGLQNVIRIGIFTTCGASWWLTCFVGAPGRRILLRGIRMLCARRCRTVFAAHYLMDSSTDRTRQRHLQRVEAKMDRLMRAD